jgi:hypothetical protein
MRIRISTGCGNGQIANFYTKSSQILNLLNLLPFVTLLQVLAAANPIDMQTHFIIVLKFCAKQNVAMHPVSTMMA